MDILVGPYTQACLDKCIMDGTDIGLHRLCTVPTPPQTSPLSVPPHMENQDTLLLLTSQSAGGARVTIDWKWLVQTQRLPASPPGGFGAA